MNARFAIVVAGAALGFALSRAPLWAAPAASAAKPQPTIVPIIFLERETSADRVFVRQAIALAIADMTAAQHEIAVAETVDVQDEAVRAFNTAAAAYNGLADIASKRRMKVAKPSSFIVDDTPALAQDARPGPDDFRFVAQCQASLNESIFLYHAESQHGKDPLVVAFAAKIRPRFVHDLELVAVDIEHLNHPAVVPTQPPPDPTSSPSP